MTQARRKRLVRIPKQDHELHILTNPLEEYDQIDSSSPPTITTPRQLTNLDSSFDYQAPLTAHSLRANSRWVIVRRNLHRIRYMGSNNVEREGGMTNFYLTFQMVRELKRAQEEIKNIDKERDFYVIKEFSLDGHSGGTKRFDLRHIKSNDALIYDRLGEEPLSLQNLFYYFSKQKVEQGTTFYDFLYEVNQVLNLKRKRTVLVKRLQRLALTIAIIIGSFIGLMFIVMIIASIATLTRMNNPEVKWMDQEYSMNI